MMNWGYLAGFFDAEGCVRTNLQIGHRPQVRVSLAQKEENILSQVRDFLAFEEIRAKVYYHRSTDSHELDIMAQRSVVLFLERIKPLCLVKREAIEANLPQAMKNAREDNLLPNPSGTGFGRFKPHSRPV